MLKIGLIGAGANTRSRHIPGLRAIPDVEILAVCNRRPESTRAVAAEFGIARVYDDWHVLLGAPDIVLLTLTEFAAQAYRINRAADLPLLVDADHGYGNALNVKRTVEELETAGVVGLTIEDTLLPTPYGATGTRLIPIEEAAGKMRARRRRKTGHRNPGHARGRCIREGRKGLDHLKLLTEGGRRSGCAWGSVGKGAGVAEFRRRRLYCHRLPLPN